MPAWLINSESVSSDFVDGEVVAIHLGTGIYYSLRGSAAQLWQSLGRPNDATSLGLALVANFEVAEDQARKDAETFARQLLQEQLIVAVQTAVDSAPAVPRGERRPYVTPQLERYADLQDLLLLDPIHEVSNQGWPHQPAKPGPQV